MQQPKINNKLDNFCNELEILSSKMAESFTLGNYGMIKSIDSKIRKNTLNTVVVTSSDGAIITCYKSSNALKNIRKKSIIKKIDPKITNKIWKSMIKAYIEYEYKNFKKR